MSTAAWSWHTGELKGYCGGCGKLLRLSLPCIDWRDITWHVDCALTELTRREASHREQLRAEIATRYGNWAVPPGLQP